MGIIKKSALLILAAASVFYAQAALSGSVKCDGGTATTVPMPVSGDNFVSYCKPCIAALRTYAREPAIKTVTASFADMIKQAPDTKFMYAEIGFPDGGRFRPHKTHREGLSVDLMVPLQGGKLMQTNIQNRYGYDVEFDRSGKGTQGRIDFKVLAKWLRSLNEQASINGGKIRRIFFAPDLQDDLFKADAKLRTLMKFNKRQAWVRHDEHIHIDFTFPCGS